MSDEQKKRKRELTDEQKQAKKIANQLYYNKTKHLKKYTHANMSEGEINKHRLRNIHANMTEKQIEMHRKRNLHENMSLQEIYKHRLRVRDPESFDKRGNLREIPTNFGYY